MSGYSFEDSDLGEVKIPHKPPVREGEPPPTTFHFFDLSDPYEFMDQLGAEMFIEKDGKLTYEETDKGRLALWKKYIVRVEGYDARISKNPKVEMLKHKFGRRQASIAMRDLLHKKILPLFKAESPQDPSGEDQKEKEKAVPLAS